MPIGTNVRRILRTLILSAALAPPGCNKSAGDKTQAAQTAASKPRLFTDTNAFADDEPMNRYAVARDSFVVARSVFPGNPPTTYSVHYSRIDRPGDDAASKIDSLMKHAIIPNEDSIRAQAESLFAMNAGICDSDACDAYSALFP